MRLMLAMAAGAAEPTAVEGAGVQVEVMQQAGKAIHGHLALLDDLSHNIDDLNPKSQIDCLAWLQA